MFFLKIDLSFKSDSKSLSNRLQMKVVINLTIVRILNYKQNQVKQTEIKKLAGLFKWTLYEHLSLNNLSVSLISLWLLFLWFFVYE